MTVEDLLEIETIRRARVRYSYYLDTGDLDGLVALFTDGAVCEFGPYGVWTGKAMIAENYAQVVGGAIREKGPFQNWRHRHQFEADVRDGISGTLVSDIVDYEIGFGPLGALAQKLFVAGQMQRTFAHRQKILESLLSQNCSIEVK